MRTHRRFIINIALTNNISLGQISTIVADTILQISINFKAVSPYTTSIFSSLIKGPSFGSFDNTTTQSIQLSHGVVISISWIFMHMNIVGIF